MTLVLAKGTLEFAAELSGPNASSGFHRFLTSFWEPGGSLGSPWETLLSRLGRLRGTVGGIFEQLYGHFLAECFFAPFRSRKSSKKVVFGGARM